MQFGVFEYPDGMPGDSNSGTTAGLTTVIIILLLALIICGIIIAIM